MVPTLTALAIFIILVFVFAVGPKIVRKFLPSGHPLQPTLAQFAARAPRNAGRVVEVLSWLVAAAILIGLVYALVRFS